ncbi:MAG: hypothetical protein J7L89_07675, partial [Bacteroidales bacterium]|nr:hypothetical protein [Bacteroidales bacterium]
NTSHSLHIEPLNDLCSGWNGRITETGTDASGSFIKVEGSYDQAGVDMTYRLDSSGWLHLTYTLHINADINPRQIGWVFDMPRDFEQLSWKRTGQWSVYPENHIGRTAGSVVPFPQKKEHHFKFGVAPAWPWEADLNPMGSNDFRATRDHLLHASLTNHSGNGLQVNGRGGHDAIRSWIGNGKVHLLVASFTTGGGDLFFSSHLKNERHPLKKGDSFSGEIQVRLH